MNSPVISEPSETARPIGLAIIGAGAAGRQHWAAVEALPDVRVIGIGDADSERAGIWQQELVTTGTLRASQVQVLSCPALLNHDDVDLVAICTPPGSHQSLACEALRAGKAVLIEKPPCAREAELDIILATAAAVRRPVGVMLQHRFRLPEHAERQRWTGDSLGVLEVVRYRPPHHYTSRPWRLDPSDSSGALFAHLAIHYADLACQLLGYPRRVTGLRETLPAAAIDQRLGIVVEFDSGATLVLAGTTVLDRRSERLAVYDRDRQLTLIDGRCDYRTSDGEVSLPAAPTSQLRAEVYRDLVQAMGEGRPPRRASLAAARGVVRLLELIGECVW